MAAGKGTFHHRLRSWTGTLTILSLPFFIWGLVCALKSRPEGVTEWLTSPLGAISALIFMAAALWYCKLEFDADGGLRSFGLLANRVVAFLGFAVSAYVILSKLLA